MKVIRSLLMVLIFVVSFSCINFCYAVIETETDDNVIVLDSYDDYEDIAAKFDDTGDTTELTNDELKLYYEDYKEYLKGYYESYVRQAPVKAVVIETKPIKEEYDVAYDYSISKYVLQPIKVRIEEGEFKGQEISLEYLLSADALNNIILAELHVGDKIFVNVAKNSDGFVAGDISNSWSTVQRTSLIVCIGIIVALLAVIYAGRKGLTTALISLIVLISALVVIPAFATTGAGVVWTGILISILLISAICMAHLGLNANTLKAIGVSACLSAFGMILVAGFNYITRTVGTTFEFAAIAENVIMGNINFTALFYIMTLFVCAGVIANTVSMCIKKIDRENADNFNDKVLLCRGYMLSNVVTITLVLFVGYVPNHLLLITNKFTNDEIINSETLVCEFVRLFAIIIPVILSAPIVSLDFLKVGKKYLKEAKEVEKEEQEIDE